MRLGFFVTKLTFAGFALSIRVPGAQTPPFAGAHSALHSPHPSGLSDLVTVFLVGLAGCCGEQISTLLAGCLFYILNSSLYLDPMRSASKTS
jgi:hypothetical protein